MASESPLTVVAVGNLLLREPQKVWLKKGGLIKNYQPGLGTVMNKELRFQK
jgi:hypothetical protein